MAHTYWQKQTSEPLFPDILWSRPESKSVAGKLAIIGGNAHAFGAPGVAYATATSSGIGHVKVLLPDAIKKTVKHVLPDADFAPSNPSGSFSTQALSSFLDIADWSDATILAGDFGRNSETAVLIESFIEKYTGLLCITQDTADYFKTITQKLFSRQNTLLVVSLAQLQKMYINLPSIIPITYGMESPQLAEAMHIITLEKPICLVTKHHDQIFVAQGGEVVSNPAPENPWRVKTASRATVFWLQNKDNATEAISSSLFV